MLDRDHTSDLANFLVGLFSSDEVEEREDNAGHVAQPFRLDFHGRPETSVQRGQDPCGPVVGGVVHVGQGLWAGETDEGAEVASRV